MRETASPFGGTGQLEHALAHVGAGDSSPDLAM